MRSMVLPVTGTLTLRRGERRRRMLVLVTLRKTAFRHVADAPTRGERLVVHRLVREDQWRGAVDAGSYFGSTSGSGFGKSRSHAAVIGAPPSFSIASFASWHPAQSCLSIVRSVTSYTPLVNGALGVIMDICL